MSWKCIRCGVESAQEGRFCPGCGLTVGATQTQGRTVLCPPSGSPPPPPTQGPPGVDVRAVVRNTVLGQECGSDHASPRLPIVAACELSAVVLDVSGSMQEAYEQGISKLMAAVRAIISLIVQKAQIDSRDQIGIVAFNQLAWEVIAPLSVGTDRRRLVEALQSLDATCGTDINAGLVVASRMLFTHRSDSVRRVVLLTDGHGGEPRDTAETLKARGVVIDVVGIGPAPDAVNEPLLQAVASVVDGVLRYQFIRDRKTLVSHFSHLAKKTRTQ